MSIHILSHTYMITQTDPKEYGLFWKNSEHHFSRLQNIYQFTQALSDL